MKGKKEYIVLFILIAALGAYLYLQRTDRVHYEIPQPQAIDAASVTALEIVSKDASVSLSKKDGVWQIEPKGYPADQAKVRRMLEVVTGLTLTDLVSDSGSFERYDLGEAGRIAVRAFAGESLSREFFLGKTAPTHQHTFVTLPDDTRVFHAKGGFRRDFAYSAAELRNMQVLSFPKDEITKIAISSQSGETVLAQSEIEPEPQDGSEEDGASPRRIVWKNQEGKEVSTPEVDALLSTLSALHCEAYLEEMSKEQAGEPETTITLTGKSDYVLSFHPAREGKTPASSSANGYVFVLADYRQESIENSIKSLK